MTDNNYVFTCQNLSKSFGNFRALEGVNLAIPKGRIVGLLGPNGSGKTTLLKLGNGLLVPSYGEILIGGNKPGIETKKIVSYLPDANYLPSWMKVSQLVQMFKDFYEDFDTARANEMLYNLSISGDLPLKTLSKGTKEKVQLILAMSRRASLYMLDEPIGGIDPAARDYVLNTIIGNYSPESSVIISTHLISDVEQILDDVIFIHSGKIVLVRSVDDIRAQEGKSVDQYFREIFRC